MLRVRRSHDEQKYGTIRAARACALPKISNPKASCKVQARADASFRLASLILGDKPASQQQSSGLYMHQRNCIVLTYVSNTIHAQVLHSRSFFLDQTAADEVLY